jgi:hypothetical protein
MSRCGVILNRILENMRGEILIGLSWRILWGRPPWMGGAIVVLGTLDLKKKKSALEINQTYRAHIFFSFEHLASSLYRLSYPFKRRICSVHNKDITFYCRFCEVHQTLLSDGCIFLVGVEFFSMTELETKFTRNFLKMRNYYWYEHITTPSITLIWKYKI